MYVYVFTCIYNVITTVEPSLILLKVAKHWYLILSLLTVLIRLVSGKPLHFWEQRRTARARKSRIRRKQRKQRNIQGPKLRVCQTRRGNLAENFSPEILKWCLALLSFWPKSNPPKTSCISNTAMLFMATAESLPHHTHRGPASCSEGKLWGCVTKLGLWGICWIQMNRSSNEPAIWLLHISLVVTQVHHQLWHRNLRILLFETVTCHATLCLVTSTERRCKGQLPNLCRNLHTAFSASFCGGSVSWNFSAVTAVTAIDFKWRKLQLSGSSHPSPEGKSEQCHLLLNMMILQSVGDVSGRMLAPTSK